MHLSPGPMYIYINAYERREPHRKFLHLLVKQRAAHDAAARRARRFVNTKGQRNEESGGRRCLMFELAIDEPYLPRL